MLSNIIIGTAGHIDHGKTALIKALNGFEGDETKEEMQRGITIDLSFSNLTKGNKNIAFIDVPGHEKLVKNMIAGAFGFDCVLLIIASNEGIMPQTKEHIEILNLLGIKDLIVVITKKDLVNSDELKNIELEILENLKKYEFNILFSSSVSIHDQKSIKTLESKLFNLDSTYKQNKNFFRYYIDRVFSPKGIGIVVTGTVLGGNIKLEDKLYICELQKEVKIKNIQIHNQNTLEANISNRAALNLSSIEANKLERGFLISKKGYLRGFDNIDISFKCLENKKLNHNKEYQLFIGSKQLNAKVLLFDSTTSLEDGFANIKTNESIFSIFGEKLIIRNANETIAGGIVLNPVSDPMKKAQKLELLKLLNNNEIEKAYELLIKIHQKGFGLISSMQRFSLTHEEAIEFSKNIKDAFVDEKELVIYPNKTKDFIKEYIINVYNKNPYALLSQNTLSLRLKWASLSFINEVLNILVYEKFLVKEGNLYKNSSIKEDIKIELENIILTRLLNEEFTPTAPYNIYNELDIDRKLGDDILKTLTSKKSVIRLQHNLFIHIENLSKILHYVKEIVKNNGYIDIKLFKQFFPISRKYLIAYLEYLDNFGEFEKYGEKRVPKRNK